jgi:hypothetical protein
MYQNSERPPLIQFNTSKLIQAISSVTGYNISVVEASADDMPELRGMLLAFDDIERYKKFIDCRPSLVPHLKAQLQEPIGAALILVSKGNNECWRRFTAIKEASHLLFEAADLAKSSNPSVLAKVLTADGGPNEKLPEVEREILLREALGIVTAVELFMSDGTHCEWMKRKVNVENQTPYQLASSLMLPQRFIEARMNAWNLAPS